MNEAKKVSESISEYSEFALPNDANGLGNVLGGKVWLTEADTTDRKELEDLFFPVRVSNVNTVWLPDGSKLTRVVIPGKRTERFPHDTEMITRILKETREMDLMVEFEKQ